MIRVRDIFLTPEQEPSQLLYEVSRQLKISASEIRKLTIVRRSIDARKKPNVRICYTVDVTVKGSETKILRKSGCKHGEIAKMSFYHIPKCNSTPENRPVVVGFGPAGMFAALVLAMAGCRPLVLERGEDAVSRHKKVEHFFRTGELDPKSNVQFGEGGAGTFSDGKLNTGVNNPRIGWILEQFVNAGASEEILYDAKPHVGTDVLLTVVQNLRKRIIQLGGEVRFCSQVTGILSSDNHVTGLQLADGEIIPCADVLLAIGHSARDTFEMLNDLGVPMEPKPFSMGVRIEHLQKKINESQYGTDNPHLPPADYKLVRHLEDGTVYTFCMCPGGYVVAAASEEGGVVTNGMSYSGRDGENANAALLVTVNPGDFPEPGALGGVSWQRKIERAAYAVSGGYRAPAQKVGDFLRGCASNGPGTVTPTYRPGVVWGDLSQILPEKIVRSLRTAIPLLDGSLKGFADADAVLTAPETRSSSPVRILRDDSRQSALRGLYPAGEGAGYAGGIMSAAIDGIMTAEAMISAWEERNGIKQ